MIRCARRPKAPRTMLERLLVLLLALATSACSTIASDSLVEAAPLINATYRPVQVRAKPGDVLEVTFSERAEWNHQTTVQADGNASFLQLDQIHVQGKTLAEIDQLLTERYVREVRGYELTVGILERTPGEVVVVGAVDNVNGVVTFEGEHLDLLEAIARAGGHNEERGNLGNVLLLRKTSPFAQPQSWRIDCRVKHWGWADPVQLMPGDLIYVPEKRVVRVTRWIDYFIRRMIPLPRLVTIS